MDSVLMTIDPAISALRPHIQPLTKNLPVPIRDAISSLLGEVCYKRLVVDIAPTSECASLAISKALGIGIVSLSAIVKLPQLLKITSSKSAEGLSFPSYLLETTAFAISLAYSARSGFPFSTYGENALVATQNVVIAALILHLSGKSAGAAAWVAAAAGAGYALANEQIVSMDLLGQMMAGAGVIGMAAKLPQIYTIWQQGGTGQLSAFAVFTYLFGSLARIYTTLQEVPDKKILYTFFAACTLNAVLAFQMFYYWNSTASAAHAGELGKKPERIAMGEGGTSATSTGASQTKVKGPTTRRRA
ncbi:hypothetical protein MMC10_000457 [Thelotrema lepadinum]|nr:hypothetical protein [Thelotrema lepadinum]